MQRANCSFLLAGLWSIVSLFRPCIVYRYVLGCSLLTVRTELKQMDSSVCLIICAELSEHLLSLVYKLNLILSARSIESVRTDSLELVLYCSHAPTLPTPAPHLFLKYQKRMGFGYHFLHNAGETRKNRVVECCYLPLLPPFFSLDTGTRDSTI